LESVFHQDAENLKGKTDYDIFPQEMAEVFRGTTKGTRARTALVRLEDPDRIFAPSAAKERC